MRLAEAARGAEAAPDDALAALVGDIFGNDGGAD